MGRIEFPAIPINAPAQQETTVVEQSNCIQPTLEGIELEQSPEIELGNCTITSNVQFRKLKKGNEWQCSIHASPDLMHLEQEGDFVAHAYNRYADMANKEHLRPGDRALLRGVINQQMIDLENGGTTQINHFYVSYIEVISRSKRTSMTVYEKEKKN